jgi:hypothetical protein
MRALAETLISHSESPGNVQLVRFTLILFALCMTATACGASRSAAPTTSTAPQYQPGSVTMTSSSPNPLQGEARAAATGDIPDNQVYVLFTDSRAGYSMKYPEGWAQSGSGNRVTFSDKNNLVRTVVQRGAALTVAKVSAELAALRASTPSLRFRPPQRIRISGRPAIKVVYTTESAPNPVTNKRVQLTVDRYYLAHGGRRAVLDLGTPVGVDNVDGYRLMAESFRWR